MCVNNTTSAPRFITPPKLIFSIDKPVNRSSMCGEKRRQDIDTERERKSISVEDLRGVRRVNIFLRRFPTCSWWSTMSL
tara:strand:- start:583 stop:819 length:237 start_codon:yes stop_codon:yes gene_type:complete